MKVHRKTSFYTMPYQWRPPIPEWATEEFRRASAARVLQRMVRRRNRRVSAVLIQEWWRRTINPEYYMV